MQRDLGPGKRSTAREMTKDYTRSHVSEAVGRHRGSAAACKPKTRLVPGPAPKRGK
jgi:hypothetical protein